MKRGLPLLAALAAASLPALAYAQSPSRVVPRERADQAPRSTTAPAQPAPAAPAQEPTAAPAFTPFALLRVEVSGSSLSAARIEAATRPFVGQTIDGATAARIADAVAAAYDGGPIAFYTVNIPAQDFGQGGVLRLVAVEGYIAEVALQGEIGDRDMSLVRAYLKKLTAEKPLRRKTLQRYIALIRDIPELNPDVQLGQGAQAGEVQLQVTVRPRLARFGIAVNNRGTALLGRTQLQGDANFYSVFRQGDQTRVSLAVPTKTSRFQYYSAFHSTPIGSEGTTLSANFGYLRTKPAFYDLNGHAYSAGVQLGHPVLRTLEKSLYVTAGVDGLNSSNALFGQTLFNDRVRTGRLGAFFNWERPTRYVGASLAVSKGLGGGLGGRTLNPEGVALDFSKVNGRLAFTSRIGKPFVIRLNGAGQTTGDRLPGSEQFALGGDEFGRGYEAALISGDKAVAGSAELALRPQKGLPKGLEGSEAYVFVDGGSVWYKARYGFPTQKLSLGSAGGGVRVAVRQKLELTVEGTYTLPNSADFLDRKDTRMVVSVRTLF